MAQNKPSGTPSAAKTYRWDDSSRAESLEQLYQATVAQVQSSKDWYTRNIRGKKNWAQLLRIAALGLLGIGTIVPVLLDVSGLQGIPASITTLVLALGAGCIGLDRFLGFSSAWMRFLTTEMTIKARLEAFKYEWEAEQIRWGGAPPTMEQTLAMVNRCAALHNEVLALVRDETQMWVQEFQASLKALDENFRALADSSRPGAVTLNVENGEQYTNGWEVYVDGHRVDTYKGATAAVSSLPPGFRKLRIVGRAKDGKQAEVETIVNIAAGQLSEQTVKLPAVN